MSEYRSELAAAHARIQHLEEELGYRRRPPKASRAPLVALAVGLTFAASCLGAGAVVFERADERMSATAAPVVAAPALKPRLYASWYPSTHVTPEVVDVDGDGTKDFVGLFWRPGADDRALYAAAVDGKTHELKWSAGPFPSQWNSTHTHFVVAGDRMVVTNSRDEVHLLSLSTGQEVRRQIVAGGTPVACALDGGDPTRVLLRESGYAPDAPPPIAIDVTNGELVEPKTARCTL